MIKKIRFRDNKNPFKWKHFEGDIILWLVRWYGRYALSYNDLVEIAAEPWFIGGSLNHLSLGTAI